MAHHFKLVLLLTLNSFTVLQDESHVDALAMGHEHHSVVTSYSCSHTQALKIDSLEIDCFALGA